MLSIAERHKYILDKLDKYGFVRISEISEELGIGAETLKDIIKELKKPGRDPREDMPKPILRKNSEYHVRAVEHRQ